MDSFFLSLLVSFLAFLSTNLENQVILLAYLHHPRYSFRSVSFGYISATAAILLGSYGLSQITLIMPRDWIHYLGLLPIALGVLEIFKLIRHSPVTSSGMELSLAPFTEQQAVIKVAAVTLASGGGFSGCLCIGICRYALFD